MGAAAGFIGSIIVIGIIGIGVWAAIFYQPIAEADILQPFLSIDNTDSSFEVNLVDIEREIIEQVNEERTARGLDALRYDEGLSNVGRAHSAWMADTGIFDHSGNEYYSCMGENIAMQTGQLMSAQQVVSLWMNSEGHRNAILFETHIAAGAGIARADNGDSYYTLILDSTLC